MMNLTVIQGLERTTRSCANLKAAGHEQAAREDLTSIFVRAGSELGIPAVVLRQLAEDALDYDRALETGAITLDKATPAARDDDGPIHLCCGCHERLERCLCPVASS
jgi:hypothetical protein